VWANHDLFFPRNSELENNTRRNVGNETDKKNKKICGEKEREYNVAERTPLATDLFDPILIQREAIMRLDL
jgi:hypothetical protein